MKEYLKNIFSITGIKMLTIVSIFFILMPVIHIVNIDSYDWITYIFTLIIISVIWFVIIYNYNHYNKKK